LLGMCLDDIPIVPLQIFRGEALAVRRSRISLIHQVGMPGQQVMVGIIRRLPLFRAFTSDLLVLGRRVVLAITKTNPFLQAMEQLMLRLELFGRVDVNT
jgi:hypothetical protein